MFKTALLLVVGSEFFSRDKRDTNSIWLTEELEARGVKVLSKCVVADDLDALTRAVEHALRSADLVISTGGLGPTEDDRTREAVSKATGRELERRQEILDELERRFRSRGRIMTDNNRRQGLIPEGSWILPNPTGTAPGFVCRYEDTYFLALPGPPREMKGMFCHFAQQYSEQFSSEQFVTARRTLRVTGLGESDMDRRISDLYKELKNPEVTINFTPHHLEIHLTAIGADQKAAESLISPLVQEIEARLRGYLFSTEDRDLAHVVVDLLRTRGLTLAAAESITGGHFAHRLCCVPGAGDVFAASTVAYREQSKIDMLSVSPQTLAEHGAVSEAVALEMVEGIHLTTDASVCLSCTGFAGPSGGTEQDPIGTAYIGFLTPARRTVKKINSSGDRNLIRSRTTQSMLFMLFQYLSDDSQFEHEKSAL